VVMHYHPVDFLICFTSRQSVDRVLHALALEGAEIMLIFQHWHQQAGALFSPLCFKVLLSISNILAHTWSAELAQVVLGSSCLVFEMMSHLLDHSDMTSYLVIAWALHLELIPSEVGYAIDEPVEPFIKQAPMLFLRANEVIHLKCDTLQFRVFIKILESHDFNLPSDSEGGILAPTVIPAMKITWGMTLVVASCNLGCRSTGWLRG
jgi:hypothetical protein